ATSAVALALTRQRLLLVLDNCEHLLGGVTNLVQAIGDHCPQVSILATSRERIGVWGERVHTLDPLSLDSGAGLSDAATLFCERAADVLGDFQPSEDETATVESIARKLEGLPLAVELAAARLGTMELGELRDRLDNRFGLLVRGRRAPARHQSLSSM